MYLLLTNPGDDLYLYLVKKGRLPQEETKKVIAQLTGAVAYTHAQNCAHRDLKLENILLDKHNDVKLADFGFTREYSPHSLLETVCGTTCYMAPEMLMHKKYSGEAVDVWSLGVILYTLLFGEMPFEEDVELETKMKILSDEPRYPDPEIIGHPLALVQSMLSKDPRTRPSLTTILNNPWLEKHGSAQRDILNEKEPKPFSTRAEKRLIRTFRAAHFDMDKVAESVLLAKCDPTAGLWALSLRREMKMESKRSNRASLNLTKLSISRRNSTTSQKEKTPLLKSLSRRSGSASRSASVVPASPVSPKHKTSSWTNASNTSAPVPVIEVEAAPENQQATRILSKSKSAGVLLGTQFGPQLNLQQNQVVSPAKSMSTVTTDKKKHLGASFKNAFMKLVMPSHSKRKLIQKKSANSLFSGLMDNLSKHSSSDKERMKEKERAYKSDVKTATISASSSSGPHSPPNAAVDPKPASPKANGTPLKSDSAPAGNDSVNSAYTNNSADFKYTSSPRHSDDLDPRSSVDNSDLVMTPTLRARPSRPVSQISQFSQISGFSQISSLSQLSSATSQISQDLSASEISVNGGATGGGRAQHPLGQRPILGRTSTSSSFSSLQSAKRRHNKSHSKASSTSSISVHSRSPSRRQSGVNSPDSQQSEKRSKGRRGSKSKSSDILNGSSSSQFSTSAMSNRYNIGTSFPRMFSSSTSANSMRSATFPKWSSSASMFSNGSSSGGGDGGLASASSSSAINGNGSRFNESAVFGSKKPSSRRRLITATSRSFSPRSSGGSSSMRSGMHRSSSSRSRKKETPIEEEVESDENESATVGLGIGVIGGSGATTNGRAGLLESQEEGEFHDVEEEEETVHPRRRKAGYEDTEPDESLEAEALPSQTQSQ